MTIDLDLICLGRAAVDLYGEQIGSKLEDIRSFDKSVGGCAANVAIGTSRQGLRVAMLTRVGDEHMGRFVKETLQKEGVDVSGVRTDPTRLTGLVLLSVQNQDTFPLIFYRENCADMALGESDVDELLMARASCLLLTGTHLSTEGTRAASIKAAGLANRVVLDIDYRPVLWKLTGHGLGEQRYVESAEVTEQLQRILPLCHLVVGTEEEILIAGGRSDLPGALRAIRALTPAPIVMKRGPLGCVIFEGPIPPNPEDGLVYPGKPVKVLNVLGAGDAFLSGFLRGWISGEPVARCAELANAMGALVVSRHTCSTAMPSREELDAFLAGEDPETLHRLTYRSPVPEPLSVLAFDHRLQLEALAPKERLVELKDAIAEAVVVAADACGSSGLGVIVDGQYGEEALARIEGRDLFMARPIEVPGTRPLTFIGAPNVELELLRWPAHHVVKCLVHCHPSDPEFRKKDEVARLLRLQAACRQLRREWMLEVLPHQGQNFDRGALPEVLHQLVESGIEPEWWKLPDPPGWDEVIRSISQNPYCRGVLLLGLAASVEEVQTAFERAPAECKGFAVGRTIFLEPAKRFLAGTLPRPEFVEAVAGGYLRLIRHWKSRNV